MKQIITPARSGILKSFQSGRRGAVEAFVLLLTFLAFPVHAGAQETEESQTLLGDFFKEHNIDFSAGGTLDYFDKYVWRGQYLDKDSVLQPGFSLSAKGLTFGYWGSYDMENQDALASDESDYYVSYSRGWEPFTFTVGHTWYDFPEGNTSSKEFFLTVAWDTFLAPTLTYTHDYEDGKDLNTDKDGNYWALGVSHSIPVVEKYGITLDLAGSVGFVDGQWLSGEGGHFTPTVGLKLPLSDSITMTPTMGYNVPFGDLSDDNIGNQDEEFFGGVKVAFAM
ncbi:MAG: TorF family putative porin [Candidatus Omnitrophota bacterium]|nr:TorF family putative porin [Candidatus Omnitrophota bacterium]MDZ4241735.1 TorF family putative porin [Candidatus Omnitrophota bacterium]